MEARAEIQVEEVPAGGDDATNEDVERGRRAEGDGSGYVIIFTLRLLHWVEISIYELEMQYIENPIKVILVEIHVGLFDLEE